MQLSRWFITQLAWSLVLAISVGAVFFSSPAPAAAQASTCSSITTPLRPGSTGPSVAALQRCLAEYGTYTGAITTTYGPRTTAAVQQFQAARGIVSSGTPATTGYGAVGARTLAALRGGNATIPQPVLDMLSVTVNPDAKIGWKTLVEANIALVSDSQDNEERVEASIMLDMMHNADATARGVVYARGSDGTDDFSLQLQFIVPDQKRGYIALGNQTSGDLLDGLKLRRLINRWFSFELPEEILLSERSADAGLAQRFVDAQRAHPTFTFVEQGSDSDTVRYAFTVNPNSLPAFTAALDGSDVPEGNADEIEVDYLRGTIAIHRATSELASLTFEAQATEDDGTMGTMTLSAQTQRLTAPALILRPARSNPIEELFEAVFEGVFSSDDSSWELP